MPREKSVGAIIFRIENGVPHYLLLHYAPSEKGKRGHWDFSKGHGEENEAEEQTLRREVLEETGINELNIILGFKQIIKYFFRRSYGLEGEARKKAPWVFKLVVFYLAETKNKEVKISDEHVDFVWLAYEEASKKLTFKNAREILKKANDFINKKPA